MCYKKLWIAVICILLLAGLMWFGKWREEDKSSKGNTGVPSVSGNSSADAAVQVMSSSSWGLSFQEEGKAPDAGVNKEELEETDGYYLGNEEEKKIYLTFDAGYENGHTEKILDALKKHNVTATFFLVGNYLESSPELVKRMLEEGHNVGNHTYHHKDMATITTQEALMQEVNDLEKLCVELTGKEMAKLYRPPQGKYCEEHLQWMKEAGYKTIFWSLAYVDWEENNQPSHEEALSKLTERVHPGAIVLLHSTSQTNGEIMDELLTKWEEMGYTFGDLKEL